MVDGKYLAGFLFLLLSSSQLQAQWAQQPWIDNSQWQSGMQSSLAGSCNIMITVQDLDGRAIAGAALVMEDTGYPAQTDASGMAEIPACTGGTVAPRVNIRASGYKSASTFLISGPTSRLEVTLERKAPIQRSAATTVDVAELDNHTQEKAQDLQRKASKALKRRQYKEAEKLLQDAVRLAPSSPAITNDLGIIALHNGDLDSAESWFKKAATAAPHQPAYLANIGLVRWQQQRPDESYDIMTQACANGYQSSLAHFILGAVGVRKGRDQEAIYHLTKISADDYPSRDLYLSMAFRNAGRTKDADRSYRKFLRRNPGSEVNGAIPREAALAAMSNQPPV